MEAADCGEPASWSPDFITGGTFGFGPEQGDSADAHLPQPAWFKDFAADVEADDNGSMLHLYRKLLQLRQTVLTATGDTSADLLDMGDTVVAYSRPATEGLDSCPSPISATSRSPCRTMRSPSQIPCR